MKLLSITDLCQNIFYHILIYLSCVYICVTDFMCACVHHSTHMGVTDKHSDSTIRVLGYLSCTHMLKLVGCNTLERALDLTVVKLGSCV